MHRRITILLIASVLVVAVHSDMLKCYMCTSYDESCGSALNNSLQPVECTVDKIWDWQRDLRQHSILSKIMNLFGIDKVEFQRTPQDMACAKIVVNVDKDTNKEVIIRTCQTAKTNNIDPCKVMGEKIQNQLGKMEYCGLCAKDACNGTTVASPEIFYALLSLLGALIHVAFYHWA